ncbi:hypothetical protein [Microbacterium lacticum]
MRWARLDGTADIDAWEILESNRHRYRGRITCPETVCGKNLHWRKRSSDGRAATFYGEHADGCDYKTTSDEQVVERELEEVDAVINTCAEMQIRLDPAGGSRATSQHSPGAPGARGRTHVHRGNDRTVRAGSTGLRPLLRKLISSPEFRADRMPLTLSDGTRTTIADGCVHAAQYVFSPGTRIVWGTIARASGNWLNAGDPHEALPAVRVSKEALPKVLEHAGVQELADLQGWHFLVEGTFTLTQGNLPTPYVSLSAPNRIVFLPPSG